MDPTIIDQKSTDSDDRLVSAISQTAPGTALRVALDGERARGR